MRSSGESCCTWLMMCSRVCVSVDISPPKPVYALCLLNDTSMIPLASNPRLTIRSGVATGDAAPVARRCASPNDFDELRWPCIPSQCSLLNSGFSHTISVPCGVIEESSM
jgi:hypothetical protein